MISEKSDKVIEITKESLITLTLKVICDLIDVAENQVDKEALKSDVIKLIDKNLKK